MLFNFDFSNKVDKLSFKIFILFNFNLNFIFKYKKNV